MNLLLISHEYPPVGAGAAGVAQSLAQELVRQGHRVIVLTTRFHRLSGWRLEDGVRVYRCRAIRKKRATSNITEMITFIISACFAAPQLVVEQQVAGVITFFSFPAGPVSWLINRLYKIPYIVSLRGGDVPGADPRLHFVHRLLTPLRRLILKNSAQIVTNALTLKELSEKTDPYEVSIIPNGVDTGFFKPRRHGDRKRLPVNFVFCGRFQPEKNLAFLIKKMSELDIKSGPNAFTLHMVGDGPLKGELERLVQKRSLEQKVVWHGWLEKDQLRSLYQEMDCLLLTSLYEGMPNAVLEAMACGLAVIAGARGAIPGIVEHGNTGFVFNPERPDEFGDLLELFIADEKLAAELGQNGLKRVRQMSGWDTIAQRYLDYLEG